MMKQYGEKHMGLLDKPKAKAVKAMNAAIRKKYPEDDMAVLRKYNTTRRDSCLRFVDAESNRFFGFGWGYGEVPQELADVPALGVVGATTCSRSARRVAKQSKRSRSFAKRPKKPEGKRNRIITASFARAATSRTYMR